MKVSIIIPVYNVSEYVERCINSVIHQTYTDLECIIVDDCTPDDSIEKCEKLIAEYNGPICFKILHHEKNRGLSAARNTGTYAATGNYIYYLDSDDYITNDCIYTIIAPLNNKPYDIIIGDFTIVGMNDWGIPKLYLAEGEYSEEVLSYYCAGLIYMMAWNKLFRKAFLEQNNIFFKEGMLHEDDHFSFRAFAYAQSTYIIRHNSYCYWVRESGIMGSQKYTKKNRDAYAETMLLIAQYINRHKNVGNELYEWLNNRYLKLVIQISHDNHISFYRIYKKLRQSYTYPLIELFKKKKIKRKQFIMRCHYLLNTPLGYYYLWLMSKCFGSEKI